MNAYYLAAGGTCPGGIGPAGDVGGTGVPAGGDTGVGTICLTRSSVITDELPLRSEKIVSIIDETIKRIAATKVSLLKKVAAPRPPKTVWLEPPPKAAPMSAPLPLWRSTTTIRITAMSRCTTESAMTMRISLKDRV